MKNNKRQGKDKNMEHKKKNKGSAQKDGIRYDYTDASDFEEEK